MEGEDAARPERATLPLTVVVPATKARVGTEQAIGAIRAALRAHDEIIVVRHPAGLSPAAARNLGALTAQNELVVFIDSDVVIHSDALELIRDRFTNEPSLDAVFGTYDDAPAGGTVAVFRNLLHHSVHVAESREPQTFWAGLGAVRRAAFLRLGGFDAGRYPRPMLEDVELGIRMRAANVRIALDPAVRGTHLKQWSLREMVRSDVRDRGIPWVRLLITHRSIPRTLNLGWRHRLSAAAITAALAALISLQWRFALPLLCMLPLLNLRFYALLGRRLGHRRLPVFVFLHLVHHLCAVAAVPLGIGAHIVRREHPSSLAHTHDQPNLGDLPPALVTVGSR